MPELPEVETVRMGLAKRLVGKMVASVTYDWPKSFPNAFADVEAQLQGAVITGVRRRAKLLLIDLNTDWVLLVHLKMTGQMVYVPQLDAYDERFGAGHPNDSLLGKLPDSTTRVTLEFSDGSRLYFNDQRKFGWMKLMPQSAVEAMDFFKRLGPEPLESDFTYELFKSRLRRRQNSMIKAVLLDQTVVAGIGNIYADECLWGARIHPATRVKDISGVKLKRLYREIPLVLRLGIEKGGSTDRNYVNAEGKKGSYLQFARVFRRENLACPRCAETIIKTRVAGRGTHLCRHCQKPVDK